MRSHLAFGLAATLAAAACSEPGTDDSVSPSAEAGVASAVASSGDAGSLGNGDAAVIAADTRRQDAAAGATSSSSEGGIDAGPATGDGGTVPEAGAPPDLASFDWKPGDYPPAPMEPTYLEMKDLPGQMGKARGYKVHVPKGYAPATPVPVLFAIHGFQQNAVMFGVEGPGWIAKSDAEGFLLVMPNGIQEDGFGGSWNAGECCGEASAQRLDDVGFIRAIYAEVRKHVNIDAKRVYATGFSNGGFMSYRLACEASDIFAAVAPASGSIGTHELAAIGTNTDADFKVCAPTTPVALLAVHGSGDGIVPYTGMKPSLDFWAEKSGCQKATKAAAQPASGGDTTCVTYEGCQGVEVTGCTIKDGGHCWFGDVGCGTGAGEFGALVVGNNSDFFKATDAVWDFLKRFHR